MHTSTHPIRAFTALAMLSLVLVACGPKVEGPFEGEGAYEGPGTQEGRYAENRSPEGWREDRGAQQARLEQQQRQRQEEQRREQARAQQRPPGEPDPASMARQREPDIAQDGAVPPAQDGAVPPDSRAVETDATLAATDEEVRQLRAAAESIRGSTDLSHADVIVALRALAATLGGMPSGAEVRDNVDQILAVAQRLEASDPQAMEHTEWVRAALRQGMDALTTLAAVGGRQDALVIQLGQVREHVGQLRSERPLLQQTARVADSLLGMADTIAAFQERPQPPAGTR